MGYSLEELRRKPRVLHQEKLTVIGGALESAPKGPAERARHVATLAGV